jgi:arylsulfatase
MRISSITCLGAVLSVAAVTLASVPAASQQPQQRPPNILVIMGDDVGWFNVGAYHRGIMSGKTPNLTGWPPKA